MLLINSSLTRTYMLAIFTGSSTSLTSVRYFWSIAVILEAVLPTAWVASSSRVSRMPLTDWASWRSICFQLSTVRSDTSASSATLTFSATSSAAVTYAFLTWVIAVFICFGVAFLTDRYAASYSLCVKTRPSPFPNQH